MLFLFEDDPSVRLIPIMLCVFEMSQSTRKVSRAPSPAIQFSRHFRREYTVYATRNRVEARAG